MDGGVELDQMEGCWAAVLIADVLPAAFEAEQGGFRTLSGVKGGLRIWILRKPLR
jgi:hypothetical protein